MTEEELSLTDGSVSIRPYQPSDVPRLYEAVWESVADLTVWLPWCHVSYSIEDSRAWVESRPDAWSRGSEYDFSIVDARYNSFLGGCGLNHIDRAKGRANLGYWVRSGQTGKGIATAAARLVAQFAFNQVGLQQIEIAAATGNMASLRVAERIGAKRDRVLADHLVVHDKVYDAVMYSLRPEGLIS